MPVVSGLLDVADGAFVTIRIAPTRPDVARRRRTGQPIPPPEQVLALIDTGAEMSEIDRPVATRLGLLPKRYGSANVPAMGGINLGAYYEVELTIPHPTAFPAQFLVLPDLEMFELDLSPFGIDAILGRDVLAYCVLIYDGLSGTFTLSY